MKRIEIESLQGASLSIMPSETGQIKTTCNQSKTIDRDVNQPTSIRTNAYWTRTLISVISVALNINLKAPAPTSTLPTSQ